MERPCDRCGTPINSGKCNNRLYCAECREIVYKENKQKAQLKYAASVKAKPKVKRVELVGGAKPKPTEPPEKPTYSINEVLRMGKRQGLSYTQMTAQLDAQIGV